MKKSSVFASLFCATLLFGAVAPAFAESAPVYDVDELPQNFDSGQADQQDLPPPPPPQTDNQSGMMVPVAQQQEYREPPAPRGTLDQRLRRVEGQVSNLQSAENAARVESLQEQVQALRGQVEQLTHGLQQMQAQQKSMYTDIDKRLSQKTVAAVTRPETPAKEATSSSLNPAAKSDKTDKTKTAKVDTAKQDTSKTTTRTASTKSEKSDKSDDQPNVAEEQQIYQTAYNYIKGKQYNDAIKALQGMLKKYPSGQFAANAHYWLGELYGLTNKNDQALKEFSAVVKTFPDSPRVSDAQLKIGLLYAASSEWDDAKDAFKSVINHYPGTASARLASQELKQLKQAGH